MLRLCFILFMLLSFPLCVFSQKETEALVRLNTANLSVYNANPSQRVGSTRTPIKGHDVYSIIFTANENISLKVNSLWVKDKTTIPLYIDKEKKPKSSTIRKGEQFTLKAEANGIYPYQKPPKRFNALALIDCEINGQKYYFEVKTFLKE